MVLDAISEKARSLDVTKVKIVERNMKKASEKGQDTFIEKVYELFFCSKQKMTGTNNHLSSMEAIDKCRI